MVEDCLTLLLVNMAPPSQKMTRVEGLKPFKTNEFESFAKEFRKLFVRPKMIYLLPDVSKIALKLFKGH